MRLNIWFWFMEFVLLTFLLLWVCQVLFLQNFYDRMKTKDIMRLADKLIVLYQQGDYQREFKELAKQNELCIEVRDRFNREHSPYDFIFLSRAGFNGMMRFNRHGDWNIPFCKKPDRFAPAYVTKICNQIEHIARVIKRKPWQFSNVSFIETIAQAEAGDIIYCDPPYYGRYVDYYNGWTEADEHALFEALSHTRAKFILSAWHHNDYRANDMLDRYWNHFNVTTREHFYHGGGHIENRHAMVEALVFNFDITEKIEAEPARQLVPDR